MRDQSNDTIQTGCAKQRKERALVKGHVKWYSEKKGYGFVIAEEYGEVFIHKSGIKEFGHFGLQKDDPVTFEVKETANGQQAVNLRPLKL